MGFVSHQVDSFTHGVLRDYGDEAPRISSGLKFPACGILVVAVAVSAVVSTCYFHDLCSRLWKTGGSVRVLSLGYRQTIYHSLKLAMSVNILLIKKQTNKQPRFNA